MLTTRHEFRHLFTVAAMIALIFGPAAVVLCQPAATVFDPDVCIRDVADPGASAEAFPDVAFNASTNRYLVVWEDDVNGADNHDIFGRFVSVDGTELGMVFAIADHSGYDERRPRVSLRVGTNEYMVVWQRSVPGGTFDIYGRMVMGGIVGPEIAIATYTEDQRNPDVEHVLATDRFVVVWEDHDSFLANPPNVIAKVLLSNGTPITELSAGSFTEAQTYPALATTTWSNEVLVTWTDSRGSPNGIHGRQLDSSGIPSLGSTLVITDQAATPGATAAAWGVATLTAPDPGRFLVVWPDGEHLHGRRVSAMDFSLFGGISTIADIPSNKGGPALVFNRSILEWWVAWQDNRDTG